MNSKLSKRLAGIVNALPLKDNLRVLEIGCGPGAMAREISRRIGNGHILAIDRSAKAIQQAISGSQDEIETGRLSFRQVAIENFDLEKDEKPFDIAVAVRVGALDGRHPEVEKQSLLNIAKALIEGGKLFIDGGNPLKEIPLEELPTLRKAIPGEEKMILELVKEVLAEYGLETDPSGTDADLSDLDKYYFENNGWFAVIDDHGKIAGSYGLYKIDNNVCELRKMYLKPGYQGKGLGKMMMTDFINKAGKLGYKEIILESNTRLDKAIGLYEKYGFTEFNPPHLSTRCNYAMRKKL